VTGSDALEDADCVLFLGVKDMGKPTQTLDRTTRRARTLIAPGAAVLDVGFNEVSLSAWSHDFAALHETDVQVTADTAVALPLLLELARELEAREPERRDERARRRAALADAHDRTRAGWEAEAARDAALRPVAPAYTGSRCSS
jgi:acetolactate synthase I/II/III large subunit